MTKSGIWLLEVRLIGFLFATINDYISSFISPSKNVFTFSGSDAAASLVDSNGQDMIVVIQSDDYDQSQGLIVVDPSQLQHMVTSAGGGHITGMYIHQKYRKKNS